MSLNLKGIHHVTAITSSSPEIYAFFTDILGMRLVKKNVNQDDLSSYHLYFADRRGSPGTAMTFFDFKGIPQALHGNNSIHRTSFRVRSDKALHYWEKRFKHYDISHQTIQTIFDRKWLFFEDFDGQKYAIVSDEKEKAIYETDIWTEGPIPNDYALLGFGPAWLKVSSHALMEKVLLDLMQMHFIKEEDALGLYEMGEGGSHAQLIIEQSEEASARQGYGAVHHLAFRVEDEKSLNEWIDYLDHLGLANSGYVDRFYFKSLYFRAYPNILFEIASDGPGFIDDEEDLESLGTSLTLPPHLRSQRAYIESQLEEFSTEVKSYEKETFDE